MTYPVARRASGCLRAVGLVGIVVAPGGVRLSAGDEALQFVHPFLGNLWRGLKGCDESGAVARPHSDRRDESGFTVGESPATLQKHNRATSYHSTVGFDVHESPLSRPLRR